MSELAKDKTKRVFCNNLQSNKWSYQISFFYEDWKDIKDTLKHSQGLKTFMRRNYNNQAFLYRLCVKHYAARAVNYLEKKSLPLPYHTIFTNKKINTTDIEARLKKQHLPFRVSSRKIQEEKISSYVQSVKSQKPHDIKSAINKLFKNHIPEGQKVRRFALLGAKHLSPLS